MVQINKADRKKLEDIGVLKSDRYGFKGMNVCNIQKGSNAKTTYIEDWMCIFLDPNRYRDIMRKYLTKEQIESMIKNVLNGYVPF